MITKSNRSASTKQGSPLLKWFRANLKTPVTALLLGCFSLWTVQSSRGATLYYDGNAATPTGNSISGAGLGNATGGWDTTTALFWAPFGGSNTIWSNATNVNDTVIFQGTAGTTTLGTAISAGQLAFYTTGNTVTGSTLTLNGASSTAGRITLGSNVAAATINSVIAGSNGLIFNGNGSGGLTLSGSAANTWTGTTTLNSGQIFVNTSTSVAANVAANSLGASTSGITFGGTATLRYDNGAATAAKTWTNGTLTATGGEGTLTLVRTAAQNLTLQLGGLGARSTGATLNFVNNATVGTQNSTKITGVTPNSFLGQGYFWGNASAGPYSLAWYDTGGFVRAINYATDTNSATVAGGATWDPLESTCRHASLSIL